jgi:Mrp family chromosome partitioning ATPase
MTHTDMGLIIVRADVTSKRNISRAIDTLRKTSPTKQLGIVINAGRFSGENGYGYNYGKEFVGKG